MIRIFPFQGKAATHDLSFDPSGWTVLSDSWDIDGAIIREYDEIDSEEHLFVSTSRLGREEKGGMQGGEEDIRSL